MINHYVYKLEDPVTGEFYYGSRSCEGECEQDSYTGSYYTWAPKDEIRLIKTILMHEFQSREDAIKSEAHLIEKYIKDPLNRNYYVPDKGFCMYGKKHSEETKKKISSVHKGKKLSKDHIKAIKKANKGRKHSEETRERMSRAKKGKKHPLFGKKGKENPLYGKKRSEEICKKISESTKGRKHSEETKKKMRGPGNPMYGKKHSKETREKMSKIRRGKKHSKETRKKISEALIGSFNSMYGKKGADHPKAKKVIHIPSGKKYKTMTDASVAYSCNVSTIWKHCNNRRRHPKFKYAEE